MSYLVSNDTIFGNTRGEEGAQRRVCISHIPSKTTVKDIQKFFGHDSVEGITINNKNKHFVFAFVQFKRPDAKTEALLMNETEFMGSKITIRNYTDRPKPDNTKAREKYRKDFEAREAKPKLEPIRHSTVQHSSHSHSSSSRNRSSSKGRSSSLSRRREISPARGRHESRSRRESSIHRRLGSPVRGRLPPDSPRGSHVSARDRDWDFIRSEIERSAPPARHHRDHHERERSPVRSRRRSRSRSRSRSPAPSLSIASEIYRQAARNAVRSPPPKPKNPFLLGTPSKLPSNGTSTALQTWKAQTGQHSSGLAPATFQVPTGSSVRVTTTNGFATASNGVSTNGFSTKPTTGHPAIEQDCQAAREVQPTMNASGSRDMPADVKLTMEMALMEGTALNLSVFQINKVIQYFEASRLKIERPSLAMQPMEPYVTEPSSITSGDSALDEDELALRLVDKCSSMNRKIHR